jgi:hypothetical protein
VYFVFIIPNPKFKSVRGLPHEAEELHGDDPAPVTTDRYKISLAEFRLLHELPDFPDWHDGARDKLHAHGVWGFY